MDIIIGRKEDTRQLRIKVGQQEFVVGAKGSVPITVSHEHCVITVDDMGNMNVKNRNPENETLVNGVSYELKKITTKDVLALGADRYVFNWDYISKLLPVTIDIRPLSPIWERFSAESLKMQIKERKFNVASRISGILTMIAIALTWAKVSSDEENGFMNPRTILYIIAILISLSVFVISWFNASKYPMKRKLLDEWFQDHYVCPNKKCNQFMGNTPYKILSKKKECPYCRAKIVKT